MPWNPSCNNILRQAFFQQVFHSQPTLRQALTVSHEASRLFVVWPCKWRENAKKAKGNKTERKLKLRRLESIL